MTRIAIVFFFVSLQLRAQLLSFGVTGAVSISPHSVDYGSVAIYEVTPFPTLFLFNAPNDFYQKPYAVGPEIEIRLPLRLSFATGMEYERLHRELSGGWNPRGSYNGDNPYVSSSAANAFTFPLLLRHNPPVGRTRLFFEAGTTLRHVGTFSGKALLFSALPPSPVPTEAPFRLETAKAIDAAITAGAGIRFRVWRIDLVPEVRFHHWTSLYEHPRQNEAMVMLTLQFRK